VLRVLNALHQIRVDRIGGGAAGPGGVLRGQTRLVGLRCTCFRRQACDVPRSRWGWAERRRRVT